MKKIVLVSNALPNGELPYSGEYIYRVKAFREGSGLGEGFPKPEFLDYELEGVGGIDGKLEKTKVITPDQPLDCRNHKYYLKNHKYYKRNNQNKKLFLEFLFHFHIIFLLYKIFIFYLLK